MRVYPGASREKSRCLNRGTSPNTKMMRILSLTFIISTVSVCYGQDPPRPVIPATFQSKVTLFQCSRVFLFSTSLATHFSSDLEGFRLVEDAKIPESSAPPLFVFELRNFLQLRVRFSLAYIARLLFFSFVCGW